MTEILDEGQPSTEQSEELGDSNSENAPETSSENELEGQGISGTEVTTPEIKEGEPSTSVLPESESESLPASSENIVDGESPKSNEESPSWPGNHTV